MSIASKGFLGRLAALVLIGIWIGSLSGCSAALMWLTKPPDTWKLTPELRSSPDTVVLDLTPFRQPELYLCGAAALAMVLTYWGHKTSVGEVVQALGTPGPEGYTGFQLLSLARREGFAAFIYRGSMLDLYLNLRKTRPLIIIKSKPGYNHYVVVIGATRQGQLILADPESGPVVARADLLGDQWRRSNYFTLLVAPRAKKKRPAPEPSSQK
jgi:ABC-type bacteriocin/lantibiotic exporter with double-glycine peptidase domain